MTAAIMFPLIEKYLDNELSQKAFCQQKNLSFAVFGYWLKKYRKAQRPAHAVAKQAAHAAFVPLRVIPSGHTTPCACELVFPNGVTLRFSQPVEADLLIQLIRSGT
jgi:hypothetical protein